MTKGKEFLQELLHEAAVTRKHLEVVPFEKSTFKPHEKSEALGRLAIHLAEIVTWWSSCIHDDKLDFIDFEPVVIENTKDLLSYFDKNLAEAKKALGSVSDQEFDSEWSMVYGEDILFTLPKSQVARLFCMNHFIHHRAQLGIYLRLLNIPVPASYGPSADDEHVTLIQKWNIIS